MKLITIVIPCFNHGSYLPDTLDSIRPLRKLDSVDVIIVDDGSSDKKTKEVLVDARGDGWNIISQNNAGLSAARNTGFQAAMTEYVMPVDSDNLVVPRYVEHVNELLSKNNTIDVVYSDCLEFGEVNGRRTVGDFNPCKLIRENYIDACAVIRKRAWMEVGGYDTTMRSGWEDWDFWLRCLSKQFRFWYVADIGFHYRVRSDSMLRTITNLKTQEIRDYVYSRYNQTLFRSIFENFDTTSMDYKIRYQNLKSQLRNGRLKSILKIIFGLEFY